MKKKIKTLIIGNGYWGKILKSNIEKKIEYDLIGISSKENITKLLSKNYDLIWIATPNSTHYDTIKKISSSTNYIVCEKPLFINQYQLDDYKNSNFDNKIFTNFIYRYDQRIIEFKRNLKKINLYNKLEIIMKQNGKKHDNIINILVSHCLSIFFFLFGTLSFHVIKIKSYHKDYVDILFETKTLKLRIACDNNSDDEKFRQIKLSNDNDLVQMVDFSKNIEGSTTPIDNLMTDLINKISSSTDNLNTSIFINSLLIRLNFLASKI